MREIKFRAWDGKRYTTDFFITSEGTVFKPHYDRDAEIVSGFTIEQFTGLHDKNDKEIYEGDIVVTDYGTGPVEYSGAGYSVDCESISEYWEASQSIEVIGNIHESPERIPLIQN